MKSIFLFGTKIRMYLCEIPVIFLLCVSIYFNDKVDGVVGLIPLILACVAIAVFMFIFLLRGISISKEEVRSVGPFSSKDSAVIKKDKVLVLTVKPRRKLRVELYGTDETPVFDWLSADEVSDGTINLYRDETVGDGRSVLRVLEYFGIPEERAREIIGCESCSEEYDYFIVSKEVKDSLECYSLHFTETV